MIVTGELERKSFAALGSYAEYIGASPDQIERVLVDEDRFVELASDSGVEIHSDDWLLLHAHMVFVYANASRNKESLQIEEVIEWAAAYGFLCGKLAIKFSVAVFDPILNGKKGIEKRYVPMRELRAWAVEKYKSQNWPSANAAALALEQQVIEHGRTINATLTKTNARRTLAEWFRKSV